ncbi:MAG: YeeE/YedE family protein [Alphaproteobacteria bacterium]|nr:YeeE/YedE family protein [Alphaproteobacteria bacterium]
MTLLIALVAGVVFGIGLTVSQMVDPARVQGFLDVAGLWAGTWDPTLAFVMAGALALAAPGFWLARKRGAPLVGERQEIPTARAIDRRLLLGAAMFGIGWGLVGYCPGPALAGLAFGLRETFIFVAAMIAGMGAYRWTLEKL